LIKNIPFDDNWYLATNPDIAKEVAFNPKFDPLAHYLQYGEREGRLPCPPPGYYKSIYSYGAYGTNNVGDEAIFDAIKLYYPKCIQLHSFKSRFSSSIEYNVPLRVSNFFKKDDYLIIGGGGLLYCKENVEYMIQLAKNAIKSGAHVDILRLGCEAAEKNYAAEIKELFSLVRFASVRSNKSVDLIYEYSGKRVCYQRDFAFELSRIVKRRNQGLRKRKRIGLALASTDDKSLRIIAQHMKEWFNKTEFEFYFLPHSRSFFDLTNNDYVTYHKLWSMLGEAHLSVKNPVELFEFEEDPVKFLDYYDQIDYFIGSRYHSLIFATLFSLPTIALATNMPKNQSFVEDYPRISLLSCPDVHRLGEAIKKLTSLF
jgi:polysaccharide pyruvyl transferase WcaK-like protein